jgi:hypothetical protein
LNEAGSVSEMHARNLRLGDLKLADQAGVSAGSGNPG